MDLTLTVEPRRQTGSRPSGRLRASGQVPGVVYGLGQEPVSVLVPWPELRRALSTDAGANALITLEIEGGTALTIVKDLQRDPVRRDVLHVDFLRVDPDAPVVVEVPVVLVGEAKEVEAYRGIVEQALKTLPVKAKPGQIPRHLEADVSELEVGSSITVADITFPEGTTTDLEPDTAVVSGVSTRFTVMAQKGLTGAEMDAADAAELGGGAPVASPAEGDAEAE